VRLDEFTIERYGAYEQRRLQLDGPGLTVIYGPNEAGKSTCLAGISDFLFRVPERTSRGSLYGADAIRLGATLTAADGRTLKLKRRAGRVRTLIDEAGAPCDDAVLSTMLGSTDRSRFEHLFGLDHESLREGGDQLLRADGEIGRLIVEAGGGLRSLVSRLDAVDQELDALFSPRKAEKRAFYKALEAFETAERTARTSLLTRDAYEKDRQAGEDARKALDAARALRRELAEVRSRLQRTERVVPGLRALGRIEAELCDHADVAGLSEDFPERFETLTASRAAAAAALVAAEQAHAALARRLEAMVVDAALVQADVPIRDIDTKVTLVAAAREARSNRAKEMEEAESQLAVLKQRLDVSSDADIAERLPSPDALELVRALATSALERRPEMAAARLAVTEAEAGAEAIRARINAAVQAGRGEPFGSAAAEFMSIPQDSASVDARMAQAVASAEAARSPALRRNRSGWRSPRERRLTLS
jgi:uncharacterized protein YhaN